MLTLQKRSSFRPVCREYSFDIGNESRFLLSGSERGSFAFYIEDFYMPERKQSELTVAISGKVNPSVQEATGMAEASAILNAKAYPLARALLPAKRLNRIFERLYAGEPEGLGRLIETSILLSQRRDSLAVELPKAAIPHLRPQFSCGESHNGRNPRLLGPLPMLASQRRRFCCCKPIPDSRGANGSLVQRRYTQDPGHAGSDQPRYAGG